jgi:Aerotolerance regulator N-terminal
MLWLNPVALFALAAVAAPILIHILIQRRAERFPFPTLRFLQPTRLAAIRRHLLEDLPLVAVRVAIIAAAVAALAGPFLVTGARGQAWDRRIVRAIVTDTVAGTPPAGSDQGVSERFFESPSLADGIRRAMLWLDTAPPARREIVVASTFPIGSITQEEVTAIPASIGVRFERTGTLPAARTVPGGRLLTSAGVRAHEITLAGVSTSLRETAVSDPGTWPIEVSAPKAERPAIDAAMAAVLSQRVWAAPSNRRARLFVANVEQPFQRPPATGSALFVGEPWIATAIAGITRDRDLHQATSRVAAGLIAVEFTSEPWQTVAFAADGRPLVVASGSAQGIVVRSAARASDMVTPLLLRAIANAIADVPDLRAAEVVPIADAVLQRWTRPAAPMVSPRIDTVDRDDRRWLWAAVLCLLALETWIRRARSADVPQLESREQARVA